MNISIVQSNLVLLGFGKGLLPFGVDGRGGDKTKATVKLFQREYNKRFKSHKLKVDGIAGRQTEIAFNNWLDSVGRIGTHNFKISEFNCKGTGRMISGGMDNNLLTGLEKLRYLAGNKAVTITSGYRTIGHNSRVGGARSSQHLLGKAVDIKVKGVSPSKVYKIADSLFNGVGRYQNFTHVDTRARRVRF